MRTSKPLFGQYDAATKHDQRALAAVCMWNGDLKSAEFLHLFTSCVGNVGRGSEIASLAWEKVVPTVVKERDGSSFTTLQTNVFRLKTAAHNAKEDEVIHFCHVDNFTECYFFIMLYHIIMEGDDMDPSGYMFPSWQNNVSSKDNSETESKISGQFRNHWMIISSIARDYVNELSCADLDNVDEESINEFCLRMFPDEMGSHGAKKLGVQFLGDSNLPPQDVIARAAWVVKSFHTFFDYWKGTRQSMMKTGKVAYGWTQGSDSLYFPSGSPPSLCDVTGEDAKKKLSLFATALLGCQCHVQDEVLDILLANVLRFYSDFIEFLAKEPRRKFGNTEHEMGKTHKFVLRVSNE